MTALPGEGGPVQLSVPLTLAKSGCAEAAWAAHASLTRAEIADPDLRGNSHWCAIKADAYGRFVAAFEAVKS